MVEVEIMAEREAEAGVMTAVDSTSSVGGDRREIRRLARRNAMLAAALGIVTRDGIPGLTMQAVSDRVGCSVGTVYTHFESKGSLVAELQDAAVRRIIASLVVVRERSRRLAVDLDAADAAAAELYLYGEFYIACWDAFPEESHLLFSVLSERGPVLPTQELGRVMGSALGLVALGHEALGAATAAGVVDDEVPSMDRVVIGAAALLGVLITSHLSRHDPVAFDHRRLTRSAWRDLLKGWGMGPEVLARAIAHVERLAEQGPLAPDPDL